jgi:hypothetical protein
MNHLKPSINGENKPFAPLTYLKHVLTWTKKTCLEMPRWEKNKNKMADWGKKELHHYTLTLTIMGIII